MPIFETSALLSYLDIVVSMIDVFFQFPMVFAGTWALPSSVKGAKELKKIMNKPFSGKQAIKSLDTIFGDDDLFDELAEMQEEEDARAVVIRHLKNMLERFDQDPEEIDFEKEALKICRGIAYKKNERNSPTNKLKRMNWKKATPEKVAALLKEGADPNVEDSEGWTPLYYAAFFNPNPEVITMLLEAGADINKRSADDDFPLLTAASHNSSFEVIETLLKAGADPYVINYFGWTLLHCAAVNPNPKVVAAALTMNIDVNAKEKDGGTPLHSAAFSNPNPEVITMLLEAGANIKAQSIEKKTPLHSAAWNNPNPEVITMLLEAGANIKAQNESKETPLHYAAWKNSNPEVIAVLLEAGADIDAQDKKKRTPLHEATWNPNPEVITMLLEAGADIEAQSIEKRTPLHEAVSELYSKADPKVTTSILVKAGADIDVKDENGKTPKEIYYERFGEKEGDAIFGSQHINKEKE